MLNTKVLVIVLALFIGVLFGQWVGVRDYKAGCEKLSNPTGTVFWYECDTSK
jgi:uncharacterized protein YneF (UPF0154 family)